MPDDPFFNLHLNDEDDTPESFPDEPMEVDAPHFPGGKGFVVDFRDPDALDKLRASLERSMEQAREHVEKAKAGQREMMRRAVQPGFFDWYLSLFGSSMVPSVRAEFVAQAALERRITQVESLVVEKLMVIDLSELEGPR